MVEKIQLSEFVEINSESISKNFPYEVIEYIDISSVGSGTLINNPEIIRLDAAPSRAKRKIQEGDTILAMVRPNLRSFMYIRNPKENTIVSTGFAVLRPKENVDSRFIYYCVSDPIFTGYLGNNAKGTSYPAVDTKTINRGEIPNFEFAEQEKIGQILALYDDLIENNKRRVELLEESARQLYKEWFVRFRFPGHEHVKIIDGVPEGWERKTASEALEINPKVAVESGAIITHVPMASLSESQMTVDTSKFETRTKHTSVRFESGDILFARITPCLENGKTAYVNFLRKGEVACGSTEFIVLRGKSVSNQFAYLMAREENFRGNAITSMIGSSGRQRVQPSCFDKYIVPVPPLRLQELFDDIVEKNFDQISTLIKQCEQLSKARDLLLPKLMSGKIAA